MPRIRSVHPEICTDETLPFVSADAERTFVRLWPHLDDDGRAVDNVRLLKAALYPLHDDMTAETVDRDLDELERNGLVTRYEVEGKRYVAAKRSSWQTYQRPRHPTPSKLPPPPEDDGGVTAVRRNSSADGGNAPAVVGVGVGEESSSAQAPKADGFLEWWAGYPRKVCRAEAQKAFEKAIRSGATCGELTASLAQWRSVWDRENRPVDKIPHAATWLNQNRWQDDPADLDETSYDDRPVVYT